MRNSFNKTLKIPRIWKNGCPKLSSLYLLNQYIIDLPYSTVVKRETNLLYWHSGTKVLQDWTMDSRKISFYYFVLLLYRLIHIFSLIKKLNFELWRKKIWRICGNSSVCLKCSKSSIHTWMWKKSSIHVQMSKKSLIHV